MRFCHVPFPLRFDQPPMVMATRAPLVNGHTEVETDVDVASIALDGVNLRAGGAIDLPDGEKLGYSVMAIGFA